MALRSVEQAAAERRALLSGAGAPLPRSSVTIGELVGALGPEAKFAAFKHLERLAR